MVQRYNHQTSIGTKRKTDHGTGQKTRTSVFSRSVMAREARLEKDSLFTK